MHVCMYICACICVYVCMDVYEYTAIPLYLQGIHPKTPRGCLKSRIAPNPIPGCFLCIRIFGKVNL